MQSYDVAVVGLGAMGSATLWQLAKAGVRAIGVDRFAPPHNQGSTHGELGSRAAPLARARRWCRWRCARIKSGARSKRKPAPTCCTRPEA